jgi:hypothetical protein
MPLRTKHRAKPNTGSPRAIDALAKRSSSVAMTTSVSGLASRQHNAGAPWSASSVRMEWPLVT